MALRAVVFSLLAACSACINAQSSDGIETILVTLERDYGSEFDAPMSSVVLTEDDLSYAVYRDLGDLHNQVANLRSIPHPNSSNTLLLFMRGVGNIDEQIIQDPSVAVHIDGVPLARSQGLNTELLDIQRIEIGLGPQGTLYGRNATGGSINIVSRTPDTTQNTFSHHFIIGQDGLLRTETKANLAFNDYLASKISYSDNQAEGSINNTGDGMARFADRDRNGYRVDTLFAPIDDLQMRLIVDHANNSDTPHFVGAVDLESTALARPSFGSSGSYRISNNYVASTSQTLILDWYINAHHRFKSTSSQRKLDDFQNQKFINWAAEAQGSQKQKSQELQLFSNSDDNYVNSTIGLFWFNEKATRNATNYLLAIDEARLAFGRDIENTSKAAYAHLSWLTPLFSRSLEVRLGGRKSWDERYVYLDRAMQKNGQIMFRPFPDIGDRDFQNFSPSMGISYYPRDNLHIYLNRNYGYKSGGFNARASSPERFSQGFDDETLVSNEIGLKAVMLDGNADINIAYFNADYEDIQLNVQSDPLDPSVSDVLNAGEASVKGIELQSNFRLSEQFRIALNYAYLNAEYDKIFAANGQNIADQYQFVGAPEHSLQLSLAGELLNTHGQQLNYQFNWSWQDDYFTVKSANTEQFSVPAYALLSGSINWTPPIQFAPAQLSLSLWGQNLLDEDYYTNRFNGTVGKITPAATWGNGRTFGIGIRVTL
jgi:iron complex outermembrane receptor protein